MKHLSIPRSASRVTRGGLAGMVVGVIGGTAGSGRQARARAGVDRGSVETGNGTFGTAPRQSTPTSWPVGLIPFFRGKAVLIDFDPSIDQAQVVMAAVDDLIRRLDRSHATQAQLVSSLPSSVARYGLSARLVGQTGEVMAFRVGPDDRLRMDPDAPMWV